MTAQPVDAAELMGAGVESRVDAWLFIGGLLAGFGEPIRDGDGYTDDEIAAARVLLPPALTEFYHLFGCRPELVANQDRLLGPHQVVIRDGVLVIREENELAASWGIPVERVGEDDPPVVIERVEWRPYLERMSLAAVEFALTEAVLGSDFESDACHVSDDLILHVRSRYRQLAFPEYVSWVNGDAWPVRWFSAPGKLLRVDPGTYPWPHVRGRTTQDIVELCADIRGEWVLGHGV